MPPSVATPGHAAARDEDPLRLAAEPEVATPARRAASAVAARRAHGVQDEAALDDEASGKVVCEPGVLAQVDPLAADGLRIRRGVLELLLLDGEQEHRRRARSRTAQGRSCSSP